MPPATGPNGLRVDAPGSLHQDPGLQPERTALAWNRTALVLIITALMFLRWIPLFGPVASFLSAGAVAVALGASIGRSRRYRRQSAGIRSESLAPAASGVAWVTAAVFVLGCAGAVQLSLGAISQFTP
ncbi:DUF202 domain-containing protein [Arthrobacter mangrovi]|uniref:Membrane protein n=1 Tax=Arthrobacter mangrovi TaxID=2966350 RepID=A0ABQ5MZ00_9MICC|nr:DUF202 domain-containing protein [Arthrobacter mangrovi]GLB69179.1 membrane protein [Arthrobacter mangrovi]